DPAVASHHSSASQPHWFCPHNRIVWPSPMLSRHSRSSQSAVLEHSCRHNRSTQKPPSHSESRTQGRASRHTPSLQISSSSHSQSAEATQKKSSSLGNHVQVSSPSQSPLRVHSCWHTPDTHTMSSEQDSSRHEWAL